MGKCQIQKVDWVQLHMPNTVRNLRVKLPAQYLIRDELKGRLRADYWLFDEDVIEQVIYEIDSKYPSMIDFEQQKKDLMEKYLVQVPGFGKFILIDDKKIFEDHVKRFICLLDMIGEKLRDALNRRLECAIKKLYDTLMPTWKVANRWWEHDPRVNTGLFHKDNMAEIQQECLVEIFRSDMTSVAKRLIHNFKPSIQYPYYDLAIEQRRNDEFRKMTKAAFSRRLEDLGRDLDWLLGTSGDPLELLDSFGPK